MKKLMKSNKILFSGIAVLLLMINLVSSFAIDSNDFSNLDYDLNSEQDKFLEQETTYELGDVNQDGEINLDDLYFLVDYMYKGGDAPGNLTLADMNQNLKVNLGDVALLIQYLIDHGIIVQDTDAPVIKLLNPDDDKTFRTSDGDKRIYFEFKVSDDSDVASCDLIIDDKVYKTIENPTKDVEIKVSVELDRDDYEWKVSCIDVYGNEDVSSERDFEIKKKSSDDDEDKFYSYEAPTKKQTDEIVFNELEPIILTLEKQTESKISLEYLIPVILVLIIILMIAMIGVAFSRR